jgi:glycosyltransferase involved in cell wall biosynthesis
VTAPVHVVHIVESFASGCLTSVATICHAARDGARHSIIHSRRPETPANFERLFPGDVSFHFVQMAREITPVKDMRALTKICALLGRIKPDVVHCHSSKAGVIGRCAARRYGLPSVYTPRAYAFLRRDVSAWRRAVYMAAEWMAARVGSLVVACGREEYELSLKFASDKNRVFCVNNAVNFEELDAILAATGASPEKKLLIGTSGRLGAQHDPGLFSALAERLNQQARWVWIGAPMEADEELSPTVERTGWLGRDEARAGVAALDIYVHTSCWDGLSIAVLEAMALARPVVATDIPANRYLIEHGVTGFLGSSVDDLAAHVHRLAVDAELRRGMGQAARRYVREHHDAAGVFQEYARLYRELAAGRVPAGKQ